MEAVQIFKSTEFGEVRTINENGIVLFCGRDVARALGYARPNETIASHAKGTVKRSTPTNFRQLMHWETDRGHVTNFMSTKRGAFVRNGMRTLGPVLRDDYEEVTA